MQKKIGILVKNLRNLIKLVNPSILSASMAFLLLIIIIPFSILLNELLIFLELENDLLINELSVNSSYLIINNIFMIISVIFVSSRLIHLISMYTKNIFHDEKENYFKSRIKSFLKMILLIVIVLFIITVNVVIKELLKNFSNQYFADMIYFLLNLISLITVIYFYYIFILPIKLDFRLILFTSFIVIVLSKISTFIYEFIIVNIIKVKYLEYYGALTNIFLFILWLYYISYIVIIGLMFLYYNYLNNE